MGITWMVICPSLVNFSNTIFNDSLNPIVPTFRDALKTQRVIDAAHLSAKEGDNM